MINVRLVLVKVVEICGYVDYVFVSYNPNSSDNSTSQESPYILLEPWVNLSKGPQGLERAKGSMQQEEMTINM